jgi:hypothetical protein
MNRYRADHCRRMKSRIDSPYTRCTSSPSFMFLHIRTKLLDGTAATSFPRGSAEQNPHDGDPSELPLFCPMLARKRHRKSVEKKSEVTDLMETLPVQDTRSSERQIVGSSGILAALATSALLIRVCWTREQSRVSASGGWRGFNGLDSCGLKIASLSAIVLCRAAWTMFASNSFSRCSDRR